MDIPAAMCHILYNINNCIFVSFTCNILYFGLCSASLKVRGKLGTPEKKRYNTIARDLHG